MIETDRNTSSTFTYVERCLSIISTIDVVFLGAKLLNCIRANIETTSYVCTLSLAIVAYLRMEDKKANCTSSLQKTSIQTHQFVRTSSFITYVARWYTTDRVDFWIRWNAEHIRHHGTVQDTVEMCRNFRFSGIDPWSQYDVVAVRSIANSANFFLFHFLFWHLVQEFPETIITH